MLVLCEGKDCTFNEMRLLDLASAETLQSKLPEGKVVDADAVVQERSRLIEYILPDETRKLYNHLKQDKRIRPLRELADIGIGYVTGNNDYFHLTKEQASRHGIPFEYMLKCVRNGPQLPGLLLKKDELEDLLEPGQCKSATQRARRTRRVASVRSRLHQGWREGRRVQELQVPIKKPVVYRSKHLRMPRLSHIHERSTGQARCQCRGCSHSEHFAHRARQRSRHSIHGFYGGIMAHKSDNVEH